MPLLPAPSAKGSDREILEDIFLNITEGFGLEGNSTGGADSGMLTATPSVTPGPGADAPGPTSKIPGDLPGGPMIDVTGATYEGIPSEDTPDYGTPIEGTGGISIQGQHLIDPDLLDLWSGN